MESENSTYRKLARLPRLTTARSIRLPALNVSINGFLWGVIDHCQFNLARVQPIQIYHTSWNGKDHGNGSWADDSHWGSEKFVFIEDNVFDNPTGH